MRSSTMTMTTMLAAAVVGLSTAGAHATPPPAAATRDAGFQGSTGGVEYRMTVTEDHRATVTEITGGRFELVHDERIVTINDAQGRVLTALPMTLHIQDRTVDIAPTLDEHGTRLTLTPVTTSEAPLRDISTYERFHEVTQRAMPEITTGAAIGAAVGILLGFPLGLFVFDIITVPLGAVIGAAVGAYAGLYLNGGQPAVDAALAYLTAPR